MERKRLETLDDQFCEFVARMVCLKPTLFVEYNARMRSLIKNDPPTRDAQSAVCRACHATLRDAERGRLLCAKCRAKPSVLQGSPLIHTMYCSSHPRFALNAETEQIVAHISAMRHIAEKECEMAEHMACSSWQAFQQRNAAAGDLNMRFSEELVRGSAAYDAPITACNPRYGSGSFYESEVRHLAVTVGGLGGKLQQLVKHSVVAWLYNLDSMIRRRFGIPLASERGCMNSVGVVVEKFANLIADRVVRLEERGENPTKYVCALAFQHVIKCENVRCEHHAEALASADIRSMRELVRLAHEQEVPERVNRLIDFLRNPCPELLKFLPQVAQQYEFAQLATGLGESNSTVRSQKLDRWHETVNTGSLVEVLEQAIKRTREWRPADFLPCVRFDEPPRLGPFLPPMGWEDNPLISSWTLVSSATHHHRRTGLDPTGLRIVLMSSALLSISADSRFFRPGVVRCDLEHMGAMLTNHRILSNHAYNALTEQLLPYMVGEPWRVARTEITNWQGSHIEDDVRQAGALLGDFSVQEIVERYGRPVKRSSDVQLVQRRDMHTALVRSTAGKMVFKPPSQYEDWFPLAVDLLLPILGQLRQTMGIATAAPSNAIGDILRLLPSVRDWVPEEGKPLRLGLVEVKNKPSVKDLLKKLEAEKSPLARLRRIKSVNVWELDPDALAKVLGK